MTLRRRHRYAAFRVFSPNSPGEKEVHEAVQRSVLELFGVYGFSTIKPKIIEYDVDKSEGIVRCSHLHLPLLRASLAYITTIEEKPAAFIILKVSGTLKTLRT